jgi:RHS repeat-associated protein
LKYNYIFGLGKKLARKNASGTVNFMYTDYLGSVRVVSDPTTWYRNYYPFGEEYGALGTSNEYKFTGKEWDEESDLYYSWHRYYSSEWGRFTQVDPLWMKYPSVTSYQYCYNNPAKFIDPTGLYTQEELYKASKYGINAVSEPTEYAQIAACNIATQAFAKYLGAIIPKGKANEMAEEFQENPYWIGIIGDQSSLGSLVNQKGDDNQLIIAIGNGHVVPLVPGISKEQSTNFNSPVTVMVMEVGRQKGYPIRKNRPINYSWTDSKLVKYYLYIGPGSPTWENANSYRESWKNHISDRFGSYNAENEMCP